MEEPPVLLRRYVDHRDQNAFAEVVRRHVDLVYGAALRRVGGNAQLAQEVTQDVFITLAKNADRLARHPALAAWLHTATRNAAANTVRAEVRRRRREEEAETLRAMTTEPDVTSAWSRLAPLIDRVIDELNDTDRAAVLLRFFDRRSFSEIGYALQLSEDAARMRVDRALDKLRSRLTRYGITSTSAALSAAMLQHAVSAAPPGMALSAIGAVETSASELSISSWFSDWTTAERIAGVAASLALLCVVATYRSSERSTLELAIAQEQIDQARLLRETDVVRAQIAQREADARASRAAAPVNPDEQQSRVKSPTSASSRTAQRRHVAAGGRRTDLTAKYSAFYRELNFTPEQIAAFETIRIQNSDTQLWIYDHASSPADERDPTRTPPSNEELERQLQAALGPNAYQAYLEYNRALPARDIAARLAGAVYRADPITPSQAEALSRALAQSSATFRSGAPLKVSDIDWEVVLRQSAELLTPNQLAALENIRQQDAFLTAVERRLDTASTDSVPVSP